MSHQNKNFAPPLIIISLLAICASRSNASNPLEETLATIQEKAFKGDSHYQGALALFHKHGEYGLSVDLEESERWAKMASEKKHGSKEEDMIVLKSLQMMQSYDDSQ